MTISVIGAIVYDEIITHKGERRESFGGITYNIAALSSILPPDVTIHPVSNVGEDRYYEVLAMLKEYPAVDTRDLVRTPGRLTHTKLVYRSITYRDEAVLDLMRPLSLEAALKAAGSEAILINFINGTELTLDVMGALCGRTKGFVQLDVHSKVSRWDAAGHKSQVRFADWREWGRHVDAIQMNEFEAGLTVGRELKDRDDFVAAGREILAEGPPIVIITLGPQGSLLFHRRDGKPYCFACPAINVEAVDTTGCGDSYSAGFLWSYLQRKDPVAAACAANIVGGINCTTSGIGHLEAARGALDQIPKWYPDLADRVASGWPGEPLSP